MQQSPLRVFVSSTWLDLQPERQAVEAALQRLRADARFTGMEYFGSRGEDTRRASLDEVDRSHIYVGLFAARYGSGITEAEYRRARERGLPCFIYFKAESTITLDKAEKDAERAAKLEELKAELRRAHTVPEFTSPDDLAARLTADLHRLILDDYASRAAGSQTPGSPVATLHQLRAPVSDFVGREKEIEALIDALRNGGSAGISGISGMGGIGKTELSLLVADRMRAEYPDAQLFIDMRGTDEKPLAAADALAACVRAFAGADAKLPEDSGELVKLYLSILDGKRALILLDNAADSAQVRPLLPPSGCALLVTSRETLALPGMKRLTLEQLQPTEARDLLTGIAPRTPPDIADRICYLCGYLPLALRAAGSLLDVTTDLDPAAYATQLHDERARLERIGKEGVDLDVEASFELSYARLQPDAARVFRQLAVFPASFDAPAEEEICQDTGHAHLSDLLRRNLILYNTVTARYRLHDLARLFAESRMSDDERNAVQERHAVHYCDVLGTADDLYLEGGEALMRGLALFDAEWANIQVGQSWSALYASDSKEAAELCANYASIGANLLHLRQQPSERIEWLKKALLAEQKLNDRPNEAVTLSNLGVAFRNMGESQRAIELFEQALAIDREFGNEGGEASDLGNLGNVYSLLGETQRAIEFYEKVLEIERKLSNRHSESRTLGNLGIVYHRLGETQRAIEFYKQSLSIRREIGDWRGEGDTLWNMSLLMASIGSLDEAIVYAEASLVIQDRIGAPDADKVRKQLAKWHMQDKEEEK